MGDEATDYSREIMEINSEIERINRDKGSLEKRIALKKKRNMLAEGEGETLGEEIELKNAKIEGLRMRIRRMENERIRAKNLGGD